MLPNASCEVIAAVDFAPEGGGVSKDVIACAMGSAARGRRTKE